MMRKALTIILATICIGAMSCRAGKGCPSNGRNVGAERVLSSDAKTQKEIKKARKFRS